MIDGLLNIAGKQLPYRRTLGACKRFDLRYQPDMTIFKLGEGKFNLEHVIYLVYVFVYAGFKAQDEAVPEWFTEEWLEDNATMDEMSLLIAAMDNQKANNTDAKKKAAQGES